MNTQSLWIDTTPSTSYSPLEKDTSCDVAIIGGGIAGLSSAFFLTQQGLKVSVIESRKIITGVTGYTTAKITSQHGLIYKYLIDNFGLEKAQLYADSNQKGLEKIQQIVNENNIDCDLLSKSTYLYIESEKDIKKIEEEVDACQKLQLPAVFEKKVLLPFKTMGAVSFKNQAQFHPRKYLLSLADLIIKKGGSIYEDTKFLGMDEGNICTVKTDKAKIHAKYVIIASNYPVYDKGFYFSRLTLKRSYVIAALLKNTVPDGMFYSASTPFHSFRSQPYDKENLFLIGGENHKTGEDSDEKKHYQNLEKYAHQTFQIKSIKYYWSTHDPVSIDRVPFIGYHTPFSKNVCIATGFGGWGMTTGTVAGLLLTDLILGKNNDWEKIYNPNRFKLKTSASTLFSEGLKETKEYTKKLLPTKKISIEEIKKGEGKVVTVNKEKLAVYKDEKGILCPLSAVCTHMGCIVKFNTAEKSWDCPCHGSRFDVTGKVIHGPAIKNLPQRSLHK